MIYIADGANIRKIDTDGVISTVIGSQDQPRSWKPISCDESMPADQVGFFFNTNFLIQIFTNKFSTCIAIHVYQRITSKRLKPNLILGF